MPKKTIRNLCVAWFFGFCISIFADDDLNSFEGRDSIIAPLASVDTEIADEGDYYSGKFSER
jgi:hypothetical protein